MTSKVNPTISEMSSFSPSLFYRHKFWTESFYPLLFVYGGAKIESYDASIALRSRCKELLSSIRMQNECGPLYYPNLATLHGKWYLPFSWWILSRHVYHSWGNGTWCLFSKTNEPTNMMEKRSTTCDGRVCFGRGPTGTLHDIISFSF